MTVGKAQNGSPIVPSSAEPIGQGGILVTPVWLRFFNNLVGSPLPILPISLTASPFAYTAAARGFVTISGGTVSNVTLTRANTMIPVSGSTVPVMNGDIVTVAYSVAPTLSFVPG